MFSSLPSRKPGTVPSPRLRIRVRLAGDRFDGHRNAVGEHVEDGRALARLLDNLAQLVWVVALQVEGDLDLLVAIADLPR